MERTAHDDRHAVLREPHDSYEAHGTVLWYPEVPAGAHRELRFEKVVGRDWFGRCLTQREHLQRSGTGRWRNQQATLTNQTRAWWTEMARELRE
jgi:hypothetical protein